MEKPMQNEHDNPGTDEPTMPENKIRRGVGDRGEGVISAVIAVQMWKTTESTTNEKIMQIGSR
jgi:hypothetical protein